MSFFTDFLIADPTEAETITETDNPCGKWPGIDVKNIGELDLANLYEILLGEGDAVDLMDEFELLSIVPEEEGAMVYELPAKLVHLLANLQDEDQQRFGAKWADTEEFRGAMEADFLTELLKNLQKLATLALGKSQSLLMHTCG